MSSAEEDNWETGSDVKAIDDGTRSLVISGRTDRRTGRRTNTQTEIGYFAMAGVF